jgi:hypothetical protein
MKENKIKMGKMRQKLISLVSILAIGALLAGCLAPSEEEIEEREPVKGVDYQIEPAEPGWNWYINKEFGYKIKYPTDWKNFEALTIGSRSSIIFSGFAIDDPKEDGFLCCSATLLKKFEEDIGKKISSPWDIEKPHIEKVKEIEYDFKLLELTNFTLQRAPGTRVIYTFHSTYDAPDGTGKRIGPEFKEIELAFLKEGYCYQLCYNFATTETFDKYSSTLGKMINSFEFI